MKLYGIPMSPFVRKARVVLELKGLDYDIVDIYPGTKTAEYLAISPLGKIPALHDGDVVICDSSVIIEYLEEQYPDTTVRPKSIEDRAKSRWLEEYGGSMLFKPCADHIFMERLTKPVMTNNPTDERIVENSITNLVPPVFDYVESQLPATGFFFGELGVADIAVATAIINATYADFDVDALRWPKLSAHLAQIMAHPVLMKCMQTEKPMIDSLKKMVGQQMVVQQMVVQA
ncbi:glutathione S-transferase family protein [uncultured Shewanella sp.]|uniref:glutathione S-transferase family protein n=1 Tax=uncultured Shewanella sp. TaxID=173975 RepID=UPI0026336E6D|nr:glutathione S-transferase family protein [uncultured Shewanella sp.]